MAKSYAEAVEDQDLAERVGEAFEQANALAYAAQALADAAIALSPTRKHAEKSRELMLELLGIALDDAIREKFDDAG